MFRVVRQRPVAVLSTALLAAMTMVAAQLVTVDTGTSQPPRHNERATQHSQGAAQQAEEAAIKEAAAAMTATIVKPITPPPAPVPTPTAAPTTTTTTTPPAPPSAPAPAAGVATPAPTTPSVVPPVGQATSWGCAAALAYLQAYAAKGFALECPGYAQGREAMTCMNTAACPNSSVIAIADPCPQAYMNETSNSYVITGVTDTPIDPFGPCP